MTTSVQIAAGFNNFGGLQGLHEISAPLFFRYERDVMTQWTGYEARPRTGAHTLKRVGLPSAVWVLQRVTEAERQLLRTTYFVGVADTAEVTIKTKNDRLNVYQVFNATMEWPELAQETFYYGTWRPMRIPFRDLRLYSAFDFSFDSREFGV